MVNLSSGVKVQLSNVLLLSQCEGKSTREFNETRHFLLDENIYYDTPLALPISHGAIRRCGLVHAQKAGTSLP